ncbi:hypothetical protein P9112_006330 [Eukaryota sp. TZLM1-RC]
MPAGKAPGPSLLNFDMIKSAVGQCPQIVDDHVHFFKSLLTLKIKVPDEMSSAHLIALKKSQSKIRPIAIGESFSRILASLVFNRIGKKPKNYLVLFNLESIQLMVLHLLSFRLMYFLILITFLI